MCWFFRKCQMEMESCRRKVKVCSPDIVKITMKFCCTFIGLTTSTSWPSCRAEARPGSRQCGAEECHGSCKKQSNFLDTKNHLRITDSANFSSSDPWAGCKWAEDREKCNNTNRNFFILLIEFKTGIFAGRNSYLLKWKDSKNGGTIWHSCTVTVVKRALRHYANQYAHPFGIPLCWGPLTMG